MPKKDHLETALMESRLGSRSAASGMNWGLEKAEEWARELLARPLLTASAATRLAGEYVYGYWYHGSNPVYRPISGTTQPIYVGKNEREGARKGCDLRVPASNVRFYNRPQD